MKKLLTSILFIFFSVVIFAQNEKNGDDPPTNLSPNFSCQGHYIEINGKKYMNGQQALVCDGITVYTFSVQVGAFHADGEEFPIETTWQGATSSGGHTAYVSADYPPGSLASEGILVKASYGEGLNTVSVQVRVFFADIKYIDDSAQQYGLDPNITVQEQFYKSQYSDDYGWKSIEEGQTDVISVLVEPEEFHSHLTFESTDPVNFPISPSSATTIPQTISINGSNNGTASVIVKLGSVAQCSHPNIKTEIKLVTYQKKTKMVEFILVKEENDDVEIIPKGQGSPYSLAILPGPNGLLDTTIPVGDPNIDDEFGTGLEINTGPNGICELTAQGDDIQLIDPGFGLPYATCTTYGSNNERDTPDPDPAANIDDEILAGEINSGENGVCEIEALDEHTGYAHSEQVNLPDAMEYVNKVYSQAIFEWIPVYSPVTYSVEVINYDKNRDGRLEVGVSDEEVDEIVENCTSCSSDPNVLQVFLTDYSHGLMGGQPQGYTPPDNPEEAYVFMGEIENSSVADKKLFFAKAIGHELGHLGFGLEHPFDQFNAPVLGLFYTSMGIDFENLMDYEHPPLDKLRKYQWDEIHE